MLHKFESDKASLVSKSRSGLCIAPEGVFGTDFRVVTAEDNFDIFVVFTADFVNIELSPRKRVVGVSFDSVVVWVLASVLLDSVSPRVSKRKVIENKKMRKQTKFDTNYIG